MSNSNLLEYWYRALASTHGVCLRVTGNISSFRTSLYKARSEAMDTSLASLSITPSPTASDELWIVKTDGTTEGT